MGGFAAMNSEERLAQISRALQDAGLTSLVMGGHAVRYYGVDRNTVDFDFFTSAPSTRDVRERLLRIELLANAREGPSWRPDDFTRFEIGRLPDGREEWLEFWLHNHLLSSFGDLHARSEQGSYGGQSVAFISLPDLLRSKETERESDWQDIALLEEVQDARNLATHDAETILRSLRSRRGFERAVTSGLFHDWDAVRNAAAQCEHAVSFAFLLPIASDAVPTPKLRGTMDEAFLPMLRSAEFGSPRHLALVEVVRRSYKRHAMEVDRLDKQARLKKK
jgi:hypothetical protein